METNGLALINASNIKIATALLFVFFFHLKLQNYDTLSHLVFYKQPFRATKKLVTVTIYFWDFSLFNKTLSKFVIMKILRRFMEATFQSFSEKLQFWQISEKLLVGSILSKSLYEVQGLKYRKFCSQVFFIHCKTAAKV